MTKFRVLSREQIYNKHFDADAVDAKGRAIGFRAMVDLYTFEEITSEPGFGYSYTTDPSPLRVIVQKTKAGKDFGASQPCKGFPTPDAAYDYIHTTIAKRIKQAQRKPT